MQHNTGPATGIPATSVLIALKNYLLLAIKLIIASRWMLLNKSQGKMMYSTKLEKACIQNIKHEQKHNYQPSPPSKFQPAADIKCYYALPLVV